MHDCGKGGRQVKRRIRRALKRAGLYNAFHITVIAVLLTGFCVTLFNVKEPEQQEEETETTQAEVMQNPETMTQTAESIEDKYKVFDTMSENWGSDDLEGFVFYDLPERYADKGYFPEKMQIYTRCLCKQNDVPYALVLAIIEHESGYEFDKTGDNGNSKGYMQIYEKWHTDRMQKLNCTDLMNPYQNVKVGIDFLSYLLKKYGTVQDALAAYNYGEKGAREHLWSNGVYVYSYNTAIMQRMKEIEEVVGK
ncbi:lytic transglycosylase domain-containing protein [Agathobacter rectalis]|uniref:Lytic transglycosylase domain-containing protein n=1 Tax=Agathobacter rectalis TaxID=39491 RepID=A0A415K1I3_9FIRM|nr:lytic transglycosylase domain-containing protein [Agathobacter rectalis]